MNVFELSALLKLDSSEYENGLKDASEKTSGIGDKLKKGLGTAAKVTAAGVTAAAGAVVSLGKSALEAGSAYESAFAQVETIMDTTQMSTNDMSKGLMELSNAMGVSTTELSSTVYNAISATGDTANALSLAEKASKLATAGFTDTGSALSVLTTAMNAYGLEASEAENISDSLIMVQNLGVTTVSELASSMGKAIASASAYGVDLANVESAYVSLTKSGISTAESTTYMASMMKELGDDGSAVSKILQDVMGKSFSELMAEGKSLGDVLEVLMEDVGGDSAALMNLWGSAEAGKAANAILSQGLTEFDNNLKTIQNTTGATQTAFETMEDTMGKRMEKVKNSWQNLLTGITQGGDISGFVNDFVDNVSSVADSFLPMVETTIQGIVQLVTKLAPKIVEMLPGMVETVLPPLMDAAVDLLLQTVDVLIASLPVLLDVAMKAIVTLADGLGDALPELIPAIVDTIYYIVEKLTQPDMMSQLIGAALKIIIGIATGLIKAIPQLLMAVPMIIANLISTFTSKDFLKQMGDVGAQLLYGLAEGLAGAVVGVIQKAKEIAGQIIGAVKNAFGVHSPSRVFAGIGDYLMQGLGNGIEDNAAYAIRSAQDMVDDLMATTEGLSLDADVNVNGKANGGGAQNGGDIIIPVYIGDSMVDEIVVDAKRRVTMRSGGYAYV